MAYGETYRSKEESPERMMKEQSLTKGAGEIDIHIQKNEVIPLSRTIHKNEL